uniref:RxLR effector candidate protein n=1 Tax=Hyaloperonospora arabidopsidis (strain Emoy2) TaxID=559515 RepID=A0A090BBB6_HYAAE|nr:RxLR effector candidate protein [Hyaloperonospora arabidopsidis Emoy2]
MRLTPADLSAIAYLSSWLPLVVSTHSSKPGRCPISSNNQRAFFLTSGSPPVMRTLRTPIRTNNLTRRAHSSSDKTCSRGRKVMSSAMQYWQRKSQRSVIDRRI